MARSDRTFSDNDVLRIIDRNLTQIERDYVICVVLAATGNIKQGSIKDVIALIKDIFGGQAFEAVRAAADLVNLILAGENRYNLDF